MNAVQVSFDRFVELETQSDTKHEFVDGYIYAMAGASRIHNTITSNLVAAIRPLVRGTPCRVFSSDILLRILEDTKGYYPDLMVTCSEDDIASEVVMKEPTFLVEVLSGSTATVDRTTKLDHYQTIDTLQQYWIIEQKERRIHVYRRDGALWVLTRHAGVDELALPFGNHSLSLDAVYEDVDFA